MLREKLKLSLNYHQLTIPASDENYYKLISEETINKFIKYVEEVGEENVLELSCCKDIEEFHNEKLKCFKTWKEFYNNIHNVYENNIMMLRCSKLKHYNISRNIDSVVSITKGSKINKNYLDFIQNILFKQNTDSSSVSTKLYLDILTQEHCFNSSSIIEWVSGFNIEKLKIMENNVIYKTLLSKPQHNEIKDVIDILRSVVLAKKIESGNLWKYVVQIALQQDSVLTMSQVLLKTFEIYLKLYQIEKDRYESHPIELEDIHCINYLDRIHYDVFKILFKNVKGINECSNNDDYNVIIKYGYKYAEDIFFREKSNSVIKENITLENYLKGNNNLTHFTRNFITGCFKVWCTDKMVLNNGNTRKNLFENFKQYCYPKLIETALKIAARD